MGSTRQTPKPREQVAGAGSGVSGLARDGILNLVGAAINQFALFGITFAVARVLGDAALGRYSQAFALRALGAIILLFGMRIAMTYFVAKFRADGDAAGVRGAVISGLTIAGSLAVAGAVALFMAARWLAVEAFGDASLTTPIRLAGASLPFAVIAIAALAATQGFKTMRAFAGIGLIFEPSLRLALTVVAISLGFGLDGALTGLVVSSATGATLAVLAIRRYLATLEPARPRLPLSQMSRFAAYSWVATIATQGLLWADIIILGLLVESSEVGIYQVSTRVVLFATAGIAPLTASLAPRVTDAWHRGHVRELRDAYLNLTSWTWRMSIPVFAILVIFAEPVLELFGSSFGSGASVTRILVAGALVETLGAPASVVLNQVGRNRLNMTFNAASLLLNVGLNFTLIPRLGIEGAAIAWVASLVAFGLLRIIAVRRVATGTAPWSRVHTRALAAVAVAATATLGVQHALSVAPLLEAIVGSAILLTTYLVFVLAFGLSKGDRTVLRILLRSVIHSRLIPTESIRRARLRRRLRHLEIASEPIRITELISPFRYDIIVRSQFFELARTNRGEWQRDPAAFVERARAHPYYTWFRHVATKAMGISEWDPAEIDRAFKHRVMSSLALLQRFEKRGVDDRYPISVQRIRLGARERLVPVDGGHRLALYHSSGMETLEPNLYRIDHAAPFMNNTEAMFELLGLDDTERQRFLSMGFPDAEDETELLERFSSPAVIVPGPTGR